MTKSNFGPENSRGSCVLVAPNVILTARHIFNDCDPDIVCACHNDYIEPGHHHRVRFRRLENGDLGTPGTDQYSVRIQSLHFPVLPAGAYCDDYDFAVGILESEVSHIEPAVIDYSDIYDPPDGSNLGSWTDYSEYFIGGWGQNAQYQLPGTLQVATMIGRPRQFGGNAVFGRIGDSGGGILVQGSCDRMRLVGLILAAYQGVAARSLPASLRSFIPPPSPCPHALSAENTPDPTVAGRVTATALIAGNSIAPISNQRWNTIPCSGWVPCASGTGRCAEGVSVGTSAGVAHAFRDPLTCWFDAAASCAGNESFDLVATERLIFNFRVNSSHQTSALRVIGGGPDPDSLSADSAVGCPPNSEPFRIVIPFHVTGNKDAVVRVAASGIVRANFAPWNGSTAPPPRPDVLNDSRVSWDLYQVSTWTVMSAPSTCRSATERARCSTRASPRSRGSGFGSSRTCWLRVHMCFASHPSSMFIFAPR